MKNHLTLPLFSLTSLVLLLGLASCNGALEDTKKAVLATAGSINDEFGTVRKAEQTLVTQITDLYDREASLDLNTKGMDVSEGGNYSTFPGNKYYYKKESKGAALYLSPGPITEVLKRQVKFLEYVDPFLEKAGQATDVQVTAFYGLNSSPTIALLSPFFDVVSLLPPGINLSVFEWYNRGLQSAGSPVWSAKPFTDLNHGWIMDVSAPVKVAATTKGVVVISVDLAKVSAKYIGTQKLPLVFIGADTTVVGLSPEAERILKISALQSVDYLKQVKENTFAPASYLLTDASHPAAIQALGKALLEGQDSFPLELDGKTYTVVRQPVSENAMLVVGLAPR